MTQDRDQYVHFTIKLLKGSFALNALWQDALHYHMIDQPDKLIAMRLTEYYELLSRGAARPGPAMPATPAAPAASPMPASAVPAPQPPLAGPNGRMVSQPLASQSQPLTGYTGERGNDVIISSAPTVSDQNADDAADYWSPL